MARKPNVFPSYLLHKQSGQARVRIDGKDVLLGEYGSEESRIRYGALIAKHAGGVQIDPFAKPKRGRLPRNDSEADPGPSVGELCLVFLRHAEGHYVKNGEPTSEISVLKSVIRPLNDLYGMLPAKDFGPLALKAVRQKMVESGWCRSSINTGVSRIRRTFKHAIANELTRVPQFEGKRPCFPGNRGESFHYIFFKIIFEGRRRRSFSSRICW